MSDWTTAANIRAKVQREWERGRILTSLYGGDALFPLSIPLRGPRGEALSERFEAVRQWITDLRAASKDARGHGYTLQWKEVQHRQLGRNQLPTTAVVENVEEGLTLIGKRREAAQFLKLTALIDTAFPALKSWIERRPLRVLELADAWPRLLAFLRWQLEHPRPDIYLRQIDLPEIDTKFIECYRGVLSELLDLTLPNETIESNATGATNFERRYGFKTKPTLIRLRLLDPDLYIHGCTDLTLPVQEFTGLTLPVRCVFITENEINGLALPVMPASLVIFGLGYGLDRLAEIHWLHNTDIWYWGDIDTHGFAMLDQLRCYFPHARSLLMDNETLQAHNKLWGEEPTPTAKALPRLTPEETRVYTALLQNKFAPRLRLEQERISYGWLKEKLAHLRESTMSRIFPTPF